ncbi:N-acetylmuramoyl-L-alanine amidase [Dolichospermum circinale]|uniref:N-acetylmuramoyl-L-alanine amidase n=1 Tax=Dolichospermum circinale TaxID=109265 RepID=UPI002331247F|nr:N-acetylmuramoyl-L-alanine amidase [Dolichospermum circinale]MDB9466335.1 N-acetylmuramoyl-L-alanine amidase [Dolichospermum circinale CS-539/09]MDB9470454.1 N-acetylmuramoyl-L-alanine amidase [Dolichospermum circinale CS-539]
MKLHWLIPSTFGTVFMLSSPALAGKLESWRFDPNQNRLEFNTSSAVQPQAQLIFDPTRLVIDLPGTEFGLPQLIQQIGGQIRAIRIGQFDAQTTRLVVELAPGYTFNSSLIKFVPINGSRWIVELPNPEVISGQNREPSTPPPLDQSSQRTPSDNSIYNVVTTNPVTPSKQVTQIERLQVTGDGFFVGVAANSPWLSGNNQLQVNPSLDNRSVNIDILGAVLSPNMGQRDLLINRYGVRRIQFSQLPSSPSVVRMTLYLDNSSRSWRAMASGNSGFIVIPDRIPKLSNNYQSSTPSVSDSLATIQSVEIGAGRQLLIRADQAISATSNWDRSSGLFRITIPNSKLANQVQSPTFNRNSPILKVRFQSPAANTVVVLVQPAAGVSFGVLNQVPSSVLALPLQTTLHPQVPEITPPVAPIDTPDLLTESSPTVKTPVEEPPLPVPKEKILVVIDPGHGGKDSGAPGLGGLLEKDVVLPISTKLARILEQNGVQVVLTRDADFFVELQGRVDIAKRVNATVFVSIHANSVDNRPEVNGLEVYYYDSGYGLAETVRQTILQNISTLNNRGTRKARFYVLRKNSMPAILVETGYMTGREDNPRLGSSDYQSRMAEGIARGVLNYLKRR